MSRTSIVLNFVVFQFVLLDSQSLYAQTSSSLVFDFTDPSIYSRSLDFSVNNGFFAVDVTAAPACLSNDPRAFGGTGTGTVVYESDDATVLCGSNQLLKLGANSVQIVTQRSDAPIRDIHVDFQSFVGTYTGYPFQAAENYTSIDLVSWEPGATINCTVSPNIPLTRFAPWYLSGIITNSTRASSPQKIDIHCDEGVTGVTLAGLETHNFPFWNGASLMTGMTINGGAEYEIVKTIAGSNPDDIQQMNPSVESVENCGQIKQNNEVKKIDLRCRNKSTFETAECSVSVTPSLGSENGGHGHAFGRPFGEINGVENFGTPIAVHIPKSGTTIEYKSPEVSGDVVLNLSGAGPDGSAIAINQTTIHVREATSFETLTMPGLSFNVQSHPNGTFGRSTMRSKLMEMVQLFQRYAEEDEDIHPSQIPGLRSEGASLPLGGLFDIDRDWTVPHCGHRDGSTIDLSMSVFIGPNAAKLKNSLKLAIRDSELIFSYARESPQNASANHWHVKSK